jgi:hypothetical protein
MASEEIAQLALGGSEGKVSDIELLEHRCP